VSLLDRVRGGDGSKFIDTTSVQVESVDFVERVIASLVGRAARKFMKVSLGQRPLRSKCRNDCVAACLLKNAARGRSYRRRAEGRAE